MLMTFAKISASNNSQLFTAEAGHKDFSGVKV